MKSIFFFFVPLRVSLKKTVFSVKHFIKSIMFLIMTCHFKLQWANFQWDHQSKSFQFKSNQIIKRFPWCVIEPFCYHQNVYNQWRLQDLWKGRAGNPNTAMPDPTRKKKKKKKKIGRKKGPKKGGRGRLIRTPLDPPLIIGRGAGKEGRGGGGGVTAHKCAINPRPPTYKMYPKWHIAPSHLQII